MVSQDSTPAVLINQSFEGLALPERGGCINEEVRLRAAFIGAYGYVVYQYLRHQFHTGGIYNDGAPSAAQFDEEKQYEVREEVTEVERTLSIQRLREAISVEFVEIFPVDEEEQPLDFTLLEAGPNRRIVRYKEDSRLRGVKIRISGLNVGTIESINAWVWACESQGGVRFRNPQPAFIKRPEAIRIDLLDNPCDEARGLEEHLSALLSIIFDEATKRSIELECRYTYQPTDSGLEISIPVVRTMPFDSDSYREALPGLAAVITRWHLDHSPPTGTFVFGVKAYSANVLKPALVLHLSQLLLPSAAIAEMG